MSSTSLSAHIPDFDLITYYAERQDSYFSRVSPWTKFLTLIFLIVAITLTRNLFILTGLFIVVFLLYALAGLPVIKLIGWYTLPVIFVLSLIGILMWSEPGIPLASAGIFGITITLTDNGLGLVVTLLLKALISVTFSLFFLMTTRYQHFTAMIARIFPSPLDQVFLMAYRFLFLTLAMTASLFKSVTSRGGGLMHSIRMQGRLFAGIFALVFIRSFEQGERVHRAMIARGYSGTYTSSGTVPRPAPGEYVMMCVMGIAVIALAFSSWKGALA
jgi:cobalt/nickel transport system permease protein